MIMCDQFCQVLLNECAPTYRANPRCSTGMPPRPTSISSRWKDSRHLLNTLQELELETEEGGGGTPIPIPANPLRPLTSKQIRDGVLSPVHMIHLRHQRS